MHHSLSRTPLIDSVEDESRLRRISEIIFPLSHNRRTADPDDSTSIDTDTLTSFRPMAIGCARPSKAGVTTSAIASSSSSASSSLPANLLECARLIESQRRNLAGEIKAPITPRPLARDPSRVGTLARKTNRPPPPLPEKRPPTHVEVTQAA